LDDPNSKTRVPTEKSAFGEKTWRAQGVDIVADFREIFQLGRPRSSLIHVKTPYFHFQTAKSAQPTIE
jgi:hypothetical protein